MAGCACRQAYSAFTAMQSISTRAPAGSPFTAKAARAGLWSPNASAYTAFTCGVSCAFHWTGANWLLGATHLCIVCHVC